LTGMAIIERQARVSEPVAEGLSAPSVPVAAMTVVELTVRLTEGDEIAWRTFHDAYYGRLRRYLLVVSGGRDEDAAEAVQGAFIRAVRHMRRFESEETLWSWLTVLARSALVDGDRKRVRYRSLLDRFLHRVVGATPKLGSGLAADADATLLALLEAELATLPPDERALLDRKYFDGMPVQAIADADGASLKAIESRLVRLRRSLRHAILNQLKRHER
jgi:RNA polymerase sigma-70 factor (ECF subfamily)